jgi:long-chain acyl-CoA synthetase
MTTAATPEQSGSRERPWLQFYGSVPTSLSYPECSFAHAVQRVAAAQPDAPALIYLGTVISYRRLLHDVERCAAGLAHLGIGAGDRLLIAMPTSPQPIIALLAANSLGATSVMVHPLAPGAELAECLRVSRARAALLLPRGHDELAGVGYPPRLEHVIESGVADSLDAPRRIAFHLLHRQRRPGGSRRRAVRWRQLLRHDASALSRQCGNPDEEAVIFFSGGTTGTPKAVVLTNRNLIAEAMQAASWVGMGPEDVMLAALPIFHGAGLGLCINTVLLHGGSAVLVPEPAPDLIARATRRTPPTLMVGIPTLYAALCRDDAPPIAGLARLRAAFSGADTLPASVKQRFERNIALLGGHATLLEGYGLTEAVSAIMAAPLEHPKPGSIGLPFPDMDAKICRPGTTEEAAAGEQGEICLSGPAVMARYLEDDAATSQALRIHADGSTWLHTGDLGHCDSDGYFYFASRFKRLIKSSGFSVHPAEVEAVLHEHPAVAEACVAGVPDPAQGERVVAFVVTRAGARAGPELAEELINACRERLIKWSCPREIIFRERLPHTPVGKVDFRRLVAEVASNAP